MNLNRLDKKLNSANKSFRTSRKKILEEIDSLSELNSCRFGAYVGERQSGLNVLLSTHDRHDEIAMSIEEAEQLRDWLNEVL